MHRILPSSAWTNENTVMTGTRYTGCQTGCIRSPRGSLFLAESSFWYRQVTWEPGGRRAESSWENGVLTIVLPRLEIHTCVKVQGWQVGV